MFEEAPIGIALVSPAGRWLRVNRVLCSIVGYTEKELLERTFQDITHPDDLADDLAHVQEACERERDYYRMEKRYIHKDGHIVWIQLNAALIRSVDGQPRYFISHVEDITSRKEMEIKLRESEGRFRRLIDEAPVMLWMSDNELQFTHFNRMSLNFTGRTFEQEKGLGWAEAVHPEDRKECVRFIREKFETGKSFRVIYRLLRRDGVYCEVKNIGVPFREPDGTLGGYIGICTDITDILNAQRDSAAYSERLTLATEIARIGVWDWHLKAALMVWDERMFEIYGLDPFPEGMVPVETWKSLIDSEDLPEALAAFHSASREKNAQSAVFKIHNPRTGIRYLLANAHVIFDDEGQPVRIIGVNWDVTEQTLAENQLRLSKEAAEAANQAKSAFLAMMSHEIRTPINGVLGFTHLLASTTLNREQRGFLYAIENGGDSLLAIINDILDYSKIEAGKVDLEQVAFSLADCVRSSTDMLSIKAAEKHLALVSGINPAVSRTVVGDVTRLRQVLTNLLSNAVKFTEKGKVALVIKPGNLSDGTPALHFTVTDTGVGMPAEKMSQLFQPFNQLDASTTRRFGGTGLGLAISHRLVELMNGEIWFESQVGVGTTAHVVISLPASKSPALGRPARMDLSSLQLEKQTTIAIAGLPILTSHARSLRILVAEDHAINQRLIVELLKRMGAVSVHLVSDGLAVGEAVENGSFDVILMDCQMPHRDGYEATRHIRALEQEDPTRHRTYIIALTAAALDGDRENALAAGMDDYLTKPLRPESLCLALRQVTNST